VHKGGFSTRSCVQPNSNTVVRVLMLLASPASFVIVLHKPFSSLSNRQQRLSLTSFCFHLDTFQLHLADVTCVKSATVLLVLLVNVIYVDNKQTAGTLRGRKLLAFWSSLLYLRLSFSVSSFSSYLLPSSLFIGPNFSFIMKGGLKVHLLAPHTCLLTLPF
jgi:hypothetical protein